MRPYCNSISKRARLLLQMCCEVISVSRGVFNASKYQIHETHQLRCKTAKGLASRRYGGIICATHQLQLLGKECTCLDAGGDASRRALRTTKSISTAVESIVLKTKGAINSQALRGSICAPPHDVELDIVWGRVGATS